MWNYLYGWSAVWISVPILVGTGIGVLSMTPPEPRIAQVCFTIALAILLSKLSWWVIAERTESLSERAIFIAIIYGATGALWFSGWMLTESRVQRFQLEKPPFGIEVRSAFVSDSGPLTLFMVGFPSMFGNTASPVFYLSYIEIINQQDIPSTIDDFKVAVSKEPEGPWEDLVPISLNTSTLYSLGASTPYPKNLGLDHGTYRLATAMMKEDMKRAAVIQTSPTLESEIKKSIQPHVPIYGWIALDSLRHVGLSPGQIYFRFKIRDAANKGGTFVAELPRKQPGDSSMNVNNGVIHVTGELVDISAFHVRYYGDSYPTPQPH